jgi:hypothetical protein
VIDKLANKSGSAIEARLMTREGRAVYVQVVMTVSVVFQLMALDLEPWFLQEIDRLCRRFLWAGTVDAHGGSCAVAWDLVCQPKCLGASVSIICASGSRRRVLSGSGSRRQTQPGRGMVLTSG